MVMATVGTHQKLGVSGDLGTGVWTREHLGELARASRIFRESLAG